MYEPNLERVLALIQSPDVVLDIGGWGRPFNRANCVMDAEPFETRLMVRAQGGDREWFTKETWIQRDLCERTPFPFGDKEIDFVICSHTLEDIRDPLWVCSEMVRVAKRGYLEVPARLLETCRGVEHRHLAGYSHHRWLIDIHGNRVTFLPKSHLIHLRECSLAPFFLRRLPIQRHFQWLFWEDSFEFTETRPWPAKDELKRFVRASLTNADWLTRILCRLG